MRVRLSGLLIFVCCLQTGSAADWPHWRGPQRNDISIEPSGWEQNHWPISNPLWTANVGQGSSSPVITNGKLYVTGWVKNREVLTCRDAKTGKELWQQSYPSPRYGRQATGDQGIYSGPSATPEYDPQTKLIYTLGIDGDLYCRDTTKQGEQKWKLNLYAEYNIARRPNVGPQRRMLRDYGYTSSPLVYRNWLLVEVGDDEGNLMAFDKLTGKRLWASENKDPAGHTGAPVRIDVEGVPCVAVLTVRNLVVTRLDESNAGKTVAEFEWTTDFANNIPTPAVSGNSIIITTAYNQYATCRVDITLKGAKQIWRAKQVCSGVCSPIIHKGHVYWAWRGVHCLDFATGEELWTGGKVGTPGSCILTSDDRLIIWADNGTLSLAETATRSPKKFTELSKTKVFSRHDAWPHVVLANGLLYCKDRQGNLNCYRVGNTDK